MSVSFGVAMAVKMMAFQIRHNVVVAFTVWLDRGHDGWLLFLHGCAG